jgi:alginate O-acetyltransferase complex protein AlgI
VLFNTLEYAKFFAAVFVVAWLLAERRWAALLPWILLGTYLLSRPTLTVSSALLVTCFGATLGVAPRLGDESILNEPRRVAAIVLVSFAPLTYLTLVDHRLDPLSYGLAALGVPPTRHWAACALGALVGPILLMQWVRSERVRLWFLLGVSYVFYAHWDYRFVPLLFASSSVDYWLGAAIARADGPRRRKLLLAATIALNLGVLAVFKYFRFGVDNARAFLGALGVDVPATTLEIALPIGISFFTFESMSYVIDVYRRQIPPHRSLLEYLSFVAFFPHLVAGPIVRPRDLLPQLAAEPRWSAEDGSRGLFLIALGLTKKVAIGDYLALNLIDRVFDAPTQYSSLECYVAVIGYALQIYCDFSGYTDIAIGSALLLGVKFPNNFDAPYKAHSVIEFWRRWHISLSTWLRDYLYVPLGGNRRGALRTYFNLMLTMLLGGLWHGASWTFVAWGALHGAALVATRLYQRIRHSRLPPFPSPPRPSWQRSLLHALAVGATFHFVAFTWIFFRAESFTEARLMLDQLARLSTFHPNLHAPVLAVLALGLLGHYVPERLFTHTRERFAASPALVQGLCLFGAAWVLQKTASADAVPFVYFQF